MYYYGHQFHPADKELELFFMGCSLKCVGCHNPELQERDDNKQKSVSEIYKEIEPYLSITKRILLMGGEPQEQQIDDLIYLCRDIKINYKHIEIILFTGYTELKNPNLTKYINLVKFGRYDINNLVDDNIQNNIKLISRNQFVVKIGV